LRYGLTRAALSERAKKRIWWGSLFATGVWVVFITLMSLQGFFADFSTFPPKMTINVVAPLIVVLAVSFRPATREILRQIPQTWILGSQSFRIPVEVFLWCLLMAEVLPVQMTFEGYNYDILSGIGGLLLAIVMWRGVRVPKAALILYNVLGLALLLTIVSLAILSMPTPLRQFMNEPANRIVAEFPFVWLPGILVVLAYTLHIFSLRKLGKGVQTNR
jgi:hypothetical protein